MVLPFYDPVRAAEDAAMVDVLSGGRLVFGAAIGYRPDEFALYRTPLEKRGARFEEALAVIRALWTAGRRSRIRARTIRSRTRASSRSPSSGRTRRSGSAAGASS